jgi:hypothetical protein
MQTHNDLPLKTWNEEGKQKVEIRVKGQIDENWSEWFEGLKIQPRGSEESIIMGEVKDQADLYGLIAKLRDLGITLLGVNVVD